MDEMKLLEDFCAAEPDPRPDWLTRARSDLTAAADVAGGRRRPWRRPAGPSWLRGWLTPLAAAAAVVAAITVPLAVLHGPGKKPALPVTTQGGPPQFFAVANGGPSVVIGSTATGKTLATVHVPYGGAVYVYGATADDRTFLLGNWSRGVGRVNVEPAFYLARFHPQSQTISLTELPHMNVGSTGAAISLSPDGTMMAVTETGPQTSELSVRIFNVTTGSSRTWTRSYSASSTPSSLATGWLANSRQFEITWRTLLGSPPSTGHRVLHSPDQYLYTDRLNIATPGTRLPEPHQQALSVFSMGSVLDEYVGPNGDVFLGLYLVHWTVEEYSPGTHRFRRLVATYRYSAVDPGVGWASDNGQILIMRGVARNAAGIFSGGRYRPLPQDNSILGYDSSVAW